MKKLLIVMLSVVVCVCLCLFAACGNGESKTNESVAVESITLNKSELTLTVGEDETLTATVSPDNATDKTVIWESSDTSVATVTGGKVTAVAAGEATITAKSGDKSATCSVTVNAAVTATAMTEEEWVEYWTSFENSESWTMNGTIRYSYGDDTEEYEGTVKKDGVNNIILNEHWDTDGIIYCSYDFDKHIRFTYGAEIDETTDEYVWEVTSRLYFNAEDAEEDFRVTLSLENVCSYMSMFYEYLTFDGVDTYSGDVEGMDVNVVFENGNVKSIEMCATYEDDEGETSSYYEKYVFSDINGTVLTVPQEALKSEENGIREEFDVKYFKWSGWIGREDLSLTVYSSEVSLLADGTYTLRVNAYDSDGDKTLRQSGTFTLGEDGEVAFSATEFTIGGEAQSVGIFVGEWLDDSLSLTINFVNYTDCSFELTHYLSSY